MANYKFRYEKNTYIPGFSATAYHCGVFIARGHGDTISEAKSEVINKVKRAHDVSVDCSEEVVGIPEC